MKQQLESNTESHRVWLFRSPIFKTVKMVEEIIHKYSGEFKKTQLWQKLPRKVMWPTYLVILEYLEEINRIVISANGVITYIWNPELAKPHLAKKHPHYDNVKENEKLKEA